MAEFEKIDLNDLEDAAGGMNGSGIFAWEKVVSNVSAGYAAMRSDPSNNEGNIILRIGNGVSFLIDKGRTWGNYIWARWNNQEGWVSRDSIDSSRGGN